MVITSEEQLNLHWDVLPLATKRAADFLHDQEWIGKSGWYLAGGTALALQVGHRKSVDLDFFTTQPSFRTASVINNFTGNDRWHADTAEDNTIYGELFDCKISFIAYPFFVPKQEFLSYGNIKIIQPKDVAVMKIIAISQRGKKRDFFDLYWLVHNLEPLEEMIKRLKDQYPSVAHDYHHILKSLVYFEDAENDPLPDIHFKATWSDIKKFFTKEIPIIMNKLI